MLKIIRSSDPMTCDYLVTTIFALPGMGKTTLGYSADSPLLLDFDQGAHRALGRKDTVRPSRWADVESLPPETIADYRSIVVDTVGTALSSKAEQIMASDVKMGRGGSLTLQGFGQLKSGFSGWLAHLKSHRKDVVLIAHVEEKQRGESTVDRLDAQGGSKSVIHQTSDLMGRLFLGDDGFRYLDFSPRGSSFGKNPPQFPILKVPDFSDDPNFLARIIQEAKDRINELTAEQTAVAEMLREWHEKVAAAEQPEDFDLLASDARELDGSAAENVKRLIWKRAQELGFTYDRESHLFLHAKAE